MLRIKFFAAALVLSLAGAVFAAGRMQQTGTQEHSARGADKPAACCQAKHKKEGRQAAAMSCDKDGAGCCKGHKADAAQATARRDGEGCCKDGAACCAGHKKEEAGAAVVKTGAGEPAESCCGGDCCKDGAACCKARHKAEGQTASADKPGGCDCCGTSCPMHSGR